MSNQPEPVDVDFFVGGVDPDTTSSIETARMIEEYKKRPDYPLECEEAEQMLAALGIPYRDCGVQARGSSLEHSERSVSDLPEDVFEESNGEGVDHEDLGVNSAFRPENPN